jgi:hypothetical protein
MKLTQKDKQPYIIFNYDTSLVDPGPAWALYQLIDDKLVAVIDPRTLADVHTSCKEILTYLVEQDVVRVYTPYSDDLQLPPTFFELDLEIDAGDEWGNLTTIDIGTFSHLFGAKRMSLIEFNYDTLECR